MDCEVSVQLFRLWRLKKKYGKDATPDLPTIILEPKETTNRILLARPCFFSEALYDSLDGARP
jgi:hypothetical protein